MKIKLTVLLLCLSSVALANHHVGGHKNKHHKEKPAHEQSHQDSLPLSEPLRQLLRQEMQQIRGGMESLVFASASADWHKLAEVGEQIKQSYVFKQKLTKAQRHELHQKLPAGFIQLDQKFHHYAGMLSHVAQKQNMELVNFYIYKMNETCGACHGSYAKDRFVGFKTKSKQDHGHH